MCIVYKMHVVVTRRHLKSDRHTCQIQYSKTQSISEVMVAEIIQANLDQKPSSYCNGKRRFFQSLIDRNASMCRPTKIGLFVIEFDCNSITFSPKLFSVVFQNEYLRVPNHYKLNYSMRKKVADVFGYGILIITYLSPIDISPLLWARNHSVTG